MNEQPTGWLGAVYAAGRAFWDPVLTKLEDEAWLSKVFRCMASAFRPHLIEAAKVTQDEKEKFKKAAESSGVLDMPDPPRTT